MSESPNARAVLEIGDETEVARILLGTHPFFEQGEAAPLHGIVYDEGALWKAAPSGVWERVDDAHVHRLAMGFSGMPKPTQGGGEVPLKVGAAFCSGVRKQVQDTTAIENFFVDRASGVAFQDKFLRIDRDGSCELEPLTPEHRCRFALDFAFDPTAECPEFAAFLASLWGPFTDDVSLEQPQLLLEWIGYLLSGRTDFQKILLMIGPPRAGKGTILRVLQALFGQSACPFKANQLGERWSTGWLRGKSVAYDPDVRRSAIGDGSESKTVEMMLSVSGEDRVPLEFKHQRDVVHTKLGVRLMMATNPPFRMSDVGAALSTRLLLLTMDRSFLDKENTRLEEQLTAELPGIVRLAVDALKVLSTRGKFVEPAAARETRRSIELAETPLLGFLEERCELGPQNAEGFEVLANGLYQEFGKWCQDTGHRKPSDSTFSETLKRLGVHKIRPAAGDRTRRYRGIRLLPAERLPGAPKLHAVK